MTPENAEIVLYAITGAGALVWIAGLRFLLASRKPKTAAPETDRWGPPDDEGPRMVSGTVDVEGEPGALSARAASVLAAGGAGSLGPVKILERTDERIVVEPLGFSPAGPARGRGFRRAELRFGSAGSGRTRVDYAMDGSGGGWLLGVGGAFQVLGLLALAAGFWLLRTFVVPADDPAIRWQTIQMLQAVHFLWPPFLFGALYRKWHRWIHVTFQALIKNLPHLE